VKDAKPFWGYIYLASMIANNYFNVVFTPNFDDLLNEACCVYADLRPVVCAHDSAVADIRVTSARPKILKLHGDFLYDSIKTTVRETESLEENTREKFQQFAREYGIVVVGYGGNDRSIMDTLDTLLRSGGFFPNGLYWCVRSNGRVSKKFARLMRQENAYWVEIDGFDEFMAELHASLGIRLPKAFREPYQATTDRLNAFIPATKEKQHPTIKKDMAELEQNVRKFEQVVSGSAASGEFDKLVPYSFLGDTLIRSDPENAAIYYDKELLKNPANLDVMEKKATALRAALRHDEALETADHMIKLAPEKPEGYAEKAYTLEHLGKPDKSVPLLDEALKHVEANSSNYAELLVSKSNALLMVGRWPEAMTAAEEALKLLPTEVAALINKAIAAKELKTNEEEVVKRLEALLEKPQQLLYGPYLRACIHAFFGKKPEMLQDLKQAIAMDVSARCNAQIDPDFRYYREDPDFRELVYVKDAKP
jgi:tetratricopeptide (TPR) repeat protein